MKGNGKTIAISMFAPIIIFLILQYIFPNSKHTFGISIFVMSLSCLYVNFKVKKVKHGIIITLINLFVYFLFFLILITIAFRNSGFSNFGYY